MINKKIIFFSCVLLLFIIGVGTVSASENNTVDTCENENTDVENSQQITVNNNNNNEGVEDTLSSDSRASINKNTESSLKTAGSINTPESITLDVSVVNNTVALVSDFGSEVAITKNITTVNGIPDVTKLGVDYAYVDENGVYTIEGSEIRRVMKLDSYCQQVYGFTPKYTFFRAVGSNVKYVISREKWNVIARSLNGYHVSQGYNAVNTPYAITVNLSGKSRYYCVYYDAQEYINGHQYTCGPTAMSMISQALNCYSSERKLAGVYLTTASDGTDESSIIQYSPTVHMKLTDIKDDEATVKSTLISGKMVFWHIRGHYMCIVGYNSATNRYLCLNPSGPSHNVAAVQWATWTEVMNTDRALKENGFMAVTPYWNLTSTEKTQTMYYYYNMGGKYTVPSNKEYCNNGYDNKVVVTADTPSNISKTTNQTVFKITSQIKGSNGLVSEGKIAIYLNNQLLKTESVKNAMVGINYTLPAYLSNKVTITAKYINSAGIGLGNVSTTFNKFTAGKKYSNSAKLAINTLILEDITAKKGDVAVFTAYVVDAKGVGVNTGKVVFKLNGNTLKQNGVPIKVSVTNGVAKLNFTVPAYSAKDYRLTAVFGNNTHRYEDTAVFTIQKLDTKITDVKFTEVKGKWTLSARVVDEKNHKVERDTKITIKINGKTVVNQVKVQDGRINMTLDLSNYKQGSHDVTIIAGENGLYKTCSLNKIITITGTPTKITGLNITKSANRFKIVAAVVDNKGVKLTGDVKLSIKFNGKTVLNKVVVKNGLINTNLDLSGCNKGTYPLSLIIGETKVYESCVLNTKITIT